MMMHRGNGCHADGEIGVMTAPAAAAAAAARLLP